MVAERWSELAEAVSPPMFWDATTLRVSAPASRDWKGWPAFKVARAESATGIELAPIVEKRGQRSSRLVLGTGPYESFLWPPAVDATQDTSDGMAALIVAAQEGDESAFIEAANEIDWLQRSPADYARAVRLALAAGAHRLARRLAVQGVERYPEHPVLQKMARILAPPRVVETEKPSTTSVRANQGWLRTHADRYKGQWVALRDGALLASAETAKELKRHLDSTDGVMLTRVF